jgi:hypothetical protein
MKIPGKWILPLERSRSGTEPLGKQFQIRCENVSNALDVQFVCQRGSDTRLRTSDIAASQRVTQIIISFGSIPRRTEILVIHFLAVFLRNLGRITFELPWRLRNVIATRTYHLFWTALQFVSCYREAKQNLQKLKEAIQKLPSGNTNSVRFPRQKPDDVLRKHNISTFRDLFEIPSEWWSTCFSKYRPGNSWPSQLAHCATTMVPIRSERTKGRNSDQGTDPAGLDGSKWNRSPSVNILQCNLTDRNHGPVFRLWPVQQGHKTRWTCSHPPGCRLKLNGHTGSFAITSRIRPWSTNGNLDRLAKVTNCANEKSTASASLPSHK